MDDLGRVPQRFGSRTHRVPERTNRIAERGCVPCFFFCRPATPPVGSSWDFWDPFMPASSPAATEDDWEETMATMSEVPMTPASEVSPAPEMAVVVSAKSKDPVEIIKELDEYFFRAAGSGNQLSFLLEVPSFSFSDQRSTGKVYGYGKSFSPLLWTWGSSSSKMDGFGKFNEEVLHNNLNGSHCSTVERLLCLGEEALFGG